MKLSLLSFILSGFFLIGCGAKKTEEATATAPPAQAESILPDSLGFLDKADIAALNASADHVDIIFYNHPISVSQDDTASVRNTVHYIMHYAPTVTYKCAPLGRLAWMANGVIVKEADIYVGTGCNYLLFIANNKPYAANAMAMEGVQFFNNILAQVKEKMQ